MKQQILKILLIILKWVAKLAIRATLIILTYVLTYLSKACDLGVLGLSELAKLLDVGVAINEDNQFEQKFTKEQIERMALDIPKDIETLEDIADFFGVSYRQARKIRSCNPVRINNPHNPQTVGV